MEAAGQQVTEAGTGRGARRVRPGRSGGSSRGTGGAGAQPGRCAGVAAGG